MRECPSCKELNGENNEYCYKCNAYIGPVESRRNKTCPTCGISYPSNKSYCDVCGKSLGSDSVDDYIPVETKSSSSSTPYVETWMYIIGFLIPLVGIILGCIQVGKNDKEGGRNLIITAIVGMVLYAIITVLF